MKNIKRLALVLLGAVIALGVAVSAETWLEDVVAQINYKIVIQYNGEEQTMADVNGTRVYPITREGTTYLPVRAISEMLGIDVEWDAENYTVVLADKAEVETEAAESETTAEAETEAAESETTAEAETEAAESETTTEAETEATESETTAEAETEAAESETTAEAETEAAESETTAETETEAAESEATAA